MAQHYWPKGDALGRQFTITWKPEVTAEVVGVVNNAKLIDIGGKPGTGKPGTDGTFLT